MTMAPVVPIQAYTLPTLAATPASPTLNGVSFSQLLTNGIDRVNDNLLQADNMVKSFALDDAIPVHQVTFALEQARLSLEFALQVRSHLVDGYQQLMNMQL